MAIPVEVPKSGNTVEECLIARWVKRTGDRVAAGDVLAEVETDKATFEITAPVAGTLLATLFEEGALVPVFATVCYIGEPGEVVGIGDSGSGIGSQERAVVPPIPAIDNPIRNPQSAIPLASAPVSPRARKLAAERAVDLSALAGSGPRGRVIERDVRRALAETTTATANWLTLTASADAAGVAALCTQVERAPRTPKITLDQIVGYCTIRAIADGIGGAVHFGFACDTPAGPVVAVVRDAHTLRLGPLARRMNELRDQAQAGTLSADALTGATAIQLPPARTDDRIVVGVSLAGAIEGTTPARFVRLLTQRIEDVEYDLIFRGS